MAGKRKRDKDENAGPDGVSAIAVPTVTALLADKPVLDELIKQGAEVDVMVEDQDKKMVWMGGVIANLKKDKGGDILIHVNGHKSKWYARTSLHLAAKGTMTGQSVATFPTVADTSSDESKDSTSSSMSSFGSESGSVSASVSASGSGSGSGFGAGGSSAAKALAVAESGSGSDKPDDDVTMDVKSA